MRKTELEKYRNQLLHLKSRLTGTIEGMRREALESDESPSHDHLADHGTAAYDQDITLTLVENEQGRIQEIDDALARMDKGTFGKCEGCAGVEGTCGKKNQPIPKARIDALPWTRFCVDHQELLERMSER